MPRFDYLAIGCVRVDTEAEYLWFVRFFTMYDS
jgi:hypothetical protein